MRPNRLHVESNQAVVVSDGRQWSAFIRNLPGQFVVRPAPVKLTLEALFADRVLHQALTQGFAGQVPQLMLLPPQLVLLLEDEPLKKMLGDAEVSLLESGRIGDIDCYRVQAKSSDGETVLWIDKKTYALRRMVFPGNVPRQALGGEGQVQSASLVADFTGAGARRQRRCQGLPVRARADGRATEGLSAARDVRSAGQEAPELKLTDLAGKAVTSASLAGKVAVLAFWAAGVPACQAVMPELEKIQEKYRGNQRVAVLAVSMDPAEVENKTLASAARQNEALDARRPRRGAAGRPGPACLGTAGRGAAGDRRHRPGPARWTRGWDWPAACRGESTSCSPAQTWPRSRRRRYQETLKQAEKWVDDVFQGKLPEEPKAVKPAPRSQPKTLKLVPLWKAPDLKSPGNILVVGPAGGPSHIFVVDEWKGVTEVGPDGRSIATHKPQLQPEELICNLRTGLSGDRPQFAAFAQGHQRMFWFDEDWRQRLIFPEDALKNPHTGIADVELGDLAGDGRLTAYVGYYGAAGIQAVSPDGKRIWSNRSLASVVRTAFTAPDAKGRRELLCANESGRLAVLDAKGELRDSITVLNWPVRSILGADLKGDGQPLWCVLSTSLEGQATSVEGRPAGLETQPVVLGINLKGDVLWKYSLPKGRHMQPIEPIIAGRLKTGAPGQWLLPGCDGSIHILAADGKPIDQFNYGAVLGGLATAVIDGKPVLLVSSENGLEALRVDGI